jgi:hypothetical protein
MTGLAILGGLIWLLGIAAAILICHLSSQPGFRRKHPGQKFEGCDRRHNPCQKDFLHQPIFGFLSSKIHDTMFDSKEK